MKKLQRSFLKRYNAIISVLLSIMGFSTACSISSCEYGAPPVEYGTPVATYKINGNVKSENTSENIPEIRVIMGYDTTYTDQSGNYSIQESTFPGDQTFTLKFEDVDGADNGSFELLEKDVEFIDPQFTGGSGTWDKGEVTKELNVKLKGKE